jgi:polysaccharide pyruvyl transferase WcaK-like protein
MPRALIAGAFGQRNPGDDALLVAFSSALPGWDVVAPSTCPAAIHCGDPVTAVPNSPRHVAGALLSSDALVLGGGTVFKLLGRSTGRRPHDLMMRGVVLARSARALGMPVALVGVGASALPDSRSRALARWLADSADMLVVRDTESADILADAGVPVPIRVGADAAWTLFGGVPGAARPSSERGRVVVTLSHHAGGAEQVPKLAAGLAKFAAQRDDVSAIELQPWQVGNAGVDDLDLARRLEAALHVAGCADVAVAPPPASVLTAAVGYRDAKLVVGQRFHSILASAAAGCRFAAVPHEAKLGALSGELGQVALPPDATASTTAELLHRAADGPGPDLGAVARHIHAAEAMLGLLRTVLEGGRNAANVDLRALQLRPAALVR